MSVSADPWSARLSNPLTLEEGQQSDNRDSSVWQSVDLFPTEIRPDWQNPMLQVAVKLAVMVLFNRHNIRDFHVF